MRRPASAERRSEHGRQEVGVEVVAQEREPQARGTDVFLGRTVVAGQSECAGRGGAVEGDVHQVLHASGDRGVDERDVLVDPVWGLRC